MEGLRLVKLCHLRLYLRFKLSHFILFVSVICARGEAPIPSSLKLCIPVSNSNTHYCQVISWPLASHTALTVEPQRCLSTYHLSLSLLPTRQPLAILTFYRYSRTMRQQRWEAQPSWGVIWGDSRTHECHGSRPMDNYPSEWTTLSLVISDFWE